MSSGIAKLSPGSPSFNQDLTAYMKQCRENMESHKREFTRLTEQQSQIAQIPPEKGQFCSKAASDNATARSSEVDAFVNNGLHAELCEEYFSYKSRCHVDHIPRVQDRVKQLLEQPELFARQMSQPDGEILRTKGIELQDELKNISIAIRKKQEEQQNSSMSTPTVTQES